MQELLRAASAATLALALAACGGQPSDEPGTQAGSDGAASSGTATVAVAAPPAAFLQCRSCHAVEPGRHGVGPSLAGVFGTRAGEIQGYAFSDAMKASGLTWDEATLDRWLEDPAGLIPGTRMVYPGMPDPARRREIIAYIKTLK